MGGVRCLGLFPKKIDFFFYAFPKEMMAMMPLDDEQKSSQRQRAYFYKKKTETRNKISGNMGWGFAGERGLWKYICKY